MKKPIPPCKDCERRSAECHSTCSEYQEYVDAQIEYKHALANEAQKYKRPIWSHTQFKQLVVDNKHVKKQWRQ